MDRFLFVAGVIALPAVCTTLGAAGVLLMRRPAGPKVQRMLCGMAAGIMLAASVWSLLLPAIDRAEKMGLPAFLPSALGLVLGAAGLLRLEQTAGQLLAGGPGQGRRMVLAVTLHNLPEGMVVGLAAASHWPAGCGQRGAGFEPGCRAAEYPGGGGRQPAPAPARKKPGRGVLGRGGLRSGRTAGGGGGFGSGGMGGGSAALADECRRRLYGVRHSPGDDPGGSAVR